MGGQSTFIEKVVTEKPTTKSVVVPALERARQAKLVEEAKAAQKKRDLEKKIAALTAKAELNNSTMLSSKQATNKGGGLFATMPSKATHTLGAASRTAVGAATPSTSIPVPLKGLNSHVATNPFAATTSSTTNTVTTDPVDNTPGGTSTASKILGFLSSKKTPSSTTNIAPVNVPVSEAAPEVQVPVVKDKLKRRTMDSKAVAQSSKESVQSDSRYTTAPLPTADTETGASSNKNTTKDEDDGYDNLLLSPPPPSAAEKGPTITAGLPLSPMERTVAPLQTPEKQPQSSAVLAAASALAVTAAVIKVERVPLAETAVSQSNSSHINHNPVTPMAAPKIEKHTQVQAVPFTKKEVCMYTCIHIHTYMHKKMSIFECICT
jgi:hypothetical protein